MLTIEEISGLVRKIVQAVDPEEVVLFGSYAKQRATRRSDLDLLIVLPTLLPRRERRTLVEHLLSTFLVRTDVHIYTREEVDDYREEPGHFLNTIYRTGKRLYRKNQSASA